MLFPKKINDNFIKVRLILPAGSVIMGPPVGTVLGQYKVDIVQFCKNFNEATKLYEKGVLLPVKISLKVGGVLNFSIMTPSISYLVKRFIIDLFEINRKKLTPLMLYKIIIIKSQNNVLKPLALYCSILGSIKSMQLKRFHFKKLEEEKNG